MFFFKKIIIREYGGHADLVIWLASGILYIENYVTMS